MGDPATQPITLRLPSKYASSSSSTPSTFTPPPIEWLHRTWSVTHSTLEMWRSARNVRITYAPLPAKTSSSSSTPPLARIDDLVEYEKSSGKGGVKSVAGVDTAAGAPDTGAWDWRGKGWLFFVGSHWEVLGWGERPLAGGSGGGGVERWVVTWFAPTVFTKEGVDVYSDRKEGGSKELVEEVLAALRKTEAKPLAEMCEKDMKEVEIKLPWKER